jgi:RimJ/RimL family protein N-acetyltransferase
MPEREKRQIVAQSETLRFRSTTEQDLDYVVSLEQAKANKRFIMPWEWDQHREALSNTDIAHLIIEMVEENSVIGFVLLAGLENVHQNIEFRRIVIATKGKGYGKKAVKLIKKLAFEEWKAHRLWLDIFEYNHLARHLYISHGFVVEGTLRECYKLGGRFESLVIMSILDIEYFGRSSSVN